MKSSVHLMSVCCVRTFFTFWDIHTFSSTNIWSLLLLCECVYMSKSSFDTDNPSLVRHVVSCLTVLVAQPTMNAENQAQLNFRASLSSSFLISDLLACVVEMKEWMQRICLCFTPSRIAESAHLFCGSIRFERFQTVRYSRYIVWLIFT